MFGDKAGGRVEIESTYSALRGTLQNSLLSTRAVAIHGFALNENAFATVDQLIAGALAHERLSKYVRLALHWYHRGCQAENDIDAFMSYYIGVETIIKGHFKAHGPAPVAVSRKTTWEPVLRRKLSEIVPPELLGNMIFKLGQASVTEEATEYGRVHAIPEDQVRLITGLGKKRNELVHGDSSVVTLDDVVKCRKLLIVLLKAELGIEGLIPIEANTHIIGLSMPFSYVGYGWPISDQQETNPG